MSVIEVASLVLALISAGALASLAILRRKTNASFREIPAYSQLNHSIGLAVEDGTRIHISLGSSNMISERSATAFAGLGMVYRLAEHTSASDQPPIASSGDGMISILSQDTLKNAYANAGADDRYDPTTRRLTGLTPYSYAAGAIPIMLDEKVSTNVLIGNFGNEIALFTDTAERKNAHSLATTDNLVSQAILFASMEKPVVGEELYAAGAYIKPDPSHSASLTIQDVLRWLIVISLLAGAALKVINLL
ncbi:MAG: hypothetical protein JXA13_13640 [Anaerolineales bacterium]|nr:hypothetical protein [Anaerolineales bacterium]